MPSTSASGRERRLLVPSEQLQEPMDADAEACVLACLILDHEKFLAWIADHEPDVFSRREHQAIYAAIKATVARGGTPDLVTLKAALSGNERSGASVVVQLMQCIELLPHTAGFGEYAEIIEGMDARRRMMHAGQLWLRSVAKGNGHAGQAALVEALVESLQRMATRFGRGGSAQGSWTLREVMGQVTTDMEAATKGETDVLPTGFYDLDREIGGGLYPRALYILAGRPGMGKTSFAETMVAHWIRNGTTKVLWFPIESGAKKSAINLLAQHSGQSVHDIRRGNLSDTGWVDVVQASGDLGVDRVRLNESARVTPEKVLAEGKLMRQSTGIDVLIVDYLQRLRTPGRNIEERTSAASMEMAEVAQELEIPVVALAQLNREAVARAGHRPGLADLRGSGQIEQDADVVMMLHRDDYYDETKESGQADVILAKNRDGRTCDVHMAWRGEQKRYESLSIESPPDARVPD